MMDSIRKIVKQIIKEEIFKETHVAQKDLEKFANDILKFMGQRCVDDYAAQVKYDPDNAKLYQLPLLFTGKMTGEGYGEIGKFVEETSIKIHPIEMIDEPETKGRLGYTPPEENNGKEYFEIKLKYEQDKLDEINGLLREKYPEITSNDVYFKLFYIFFSTLLHELQHAYDAWRSKGKAFRPQFSAEYIRQQELANKIKFKGDLTPEELEAIGNSYKAYLNLVHEINARYAQTMHRVRIKGFDDNFNDTLNPWKDVFSQFKLNFNGWRLLSDKMKKKLTRRLAKAYQEESENLKSATEKYSKVVAEDFAPKKLEYRIEHMGAHHGQEDLELGLYIDDEIIGMVQYTLFDGELTVRDIIVRPEFRRQGYGSRMMKYIKQLHPEHKYVPSLKTDLGAKFIHKDIELSELRKMVNEILCELNYDDDVNDYISRQTLKVEYVPTKTLRPIISFEDEYYYDRFKDGIHKPILVTKENMHIVDGNHRWKYAKDNHIDKIPVIFIEEIPMHIRKKTINKLKSIIDSGSFLNEASMGPGGELIDFDFKFTYPYDEIWDLIRHYVRENEKTWQQFGWAVFDSDYPSDKYKSERHTFFRVEKIDDFAGGWNRPILDILNSDEEAYERARKAGFILDDDGIVLGLNGVNLVDQINEDIEFRDDSDEEDVWDRVRIIARNKEGEKVGYAILDMTMLPEYEFNTDDESSREYSDEELEKHFPDEYSVAKLEHLEVYPKFK